MKSEEMRKDHSTPLYPPKSNQHIRITAAEASSMQWDLINGWKPTSDVWPFYHGVGGIGVATAIAGAYYNSYYRKVMKLAHYGRMTSYLPVVVVPSTLAILCHVRWVSSDVIIQETRCPVCVELRAVVLQLGLGVVYPLIMAPLGSFFIASQSYTYTVPRFTPIREFLGHWWKITRPLTNRIHATIVLQAAIAVAVTYLEYNSIETINKKLDMQTTS